MNRPTRHLRLNGGVLTEGSSVVDGLDSDVVVANSIIDVDTLDMSGEFADGLEGGLIDDSWGDSC